MYYLQLSDGNFVLDEDGNRRYGWGTRDAVFADATRLAKGTGKTCYVFDEPARGTKVHIATIHPDGRLTWEIQVKNPYQ